MNDRTAALELSTYLHLKQEARDNTYIRASSIGECRRKIAYRILAHRIRGIEPAVWSHLLSIFELGEGVHLKLQERLSNVGMGWVDATPGIVKGKFGWIGDCEVPLVDHEYRVAGHCDALTRPLVRYSRIIGGEEVEFLEPGDGGKRYIIDVKTISARDTHLIDEDPDCGILDYEVKRSAFERLEKPKREHVQQASLYAWMTTRPSCLSQPLTEIPGIMIIYVAKDLSPDYYERHPEEFEDPRGLLNHPYKVFSQSTSSKTVNTVLEKIQDIWNAVDKDTLPDRDFEYTPEDRKWQCETCPYRAACYSKEGYFTTHMEQLPARLAYRMRGMQ